MTLRTHATRLFIALALTATPAFVTGCAVETDYSEVVQDVTAKSGRFETFVGKDKQHYFHLLAANGEKMMRSEGYASLGGAEAGVASCQTNGVDPNSFELLQARNGQYYWNLLAQNGEVLGTSELYTTKSSALKSIGTTSSIIAKTSVVSDAPTGTTLFQLFRGLDGKYYFHLRAKNGEIVLQSQGYKQRASAKNGIVSVLDNGVVEASYEVKEAADGQHYFVLEAQNGKVIGVGETYSSKWNAERGVETVVELLQSGEVLSAE
ncbi:MAG: DUF1508 domain-containing protein [Myxococcales bacterium]|nr:DUF1508 domain-containing protein [Myxococcales bacterium]